MVECGGLENRFTSSGRDEGSNPSPSASSSEVPANSRPRGHGVASISRIGAGWHPQHAAISPGVAQQADRAPIARCSVVLGAVEGGTASPAGNWRTSPRSRPRLRRCERRCYRPTHPSQPPSSDWPCRKTRLPQLLASSAPWALSAANWALASSSRRASPITILSQAGERVSAIRFAGPPPLPR